MFELGMNFMSVAAQEHCEHVNERINWFAQADRKFLPVTVTVAHNGTIGRSKKDGNFTIARLTVASEIGTPT
jgi:hypothetical protein